MRSQLQRPSRGFPLSLSFCKAPESQPTRLPINMRLQIAAAFLTLATPIFAVPTKGKGDCDLVVKKGESIQAAIDKAKPGSKITVEAGEYVEQLTIDKDGIRLIGKDAVLRAPKVEDFKKNFCSGLTQIFPPNATTGIETDAGICVSGRGFQLGPYDPTLFHKDITVVGEYVKDVVVEGFTISGFPGEAIAVIGGDNVKISKNKLVDSIQYGFLTIGSKNTIAEKNDVTSNFPFVTFIGMCMDDESDAVFKDNNISNYYIALCGQTSGGLIRKNTATNICIGVFADPGIKGLQIIDNSISTRNPLCPPDAGAGVVIFGASNTLVKRNTIENIKNEGRGAAIYISDAPGNLATGNVIKNNVLKNNDNDVVPVNSAMDNVITGSKCEGAQGGICNV